MSHHDPFEHASELSRRGFAARAAQSFLGLGAVPFLANAVAAQDAKRLSGFNKDGRNVAPVPLRPASAQSVIYLYMSGGMSHLDTLDVKPGAETQGPTKAISTNVDGVQLSEHFPNLARHMDKCCVINSLSSTQGAHAQGQYFMHTSYEMRGTIKHPSIGAWLSYMKGKANPTLPAHIQVGGGAYTAAGGFFDTKHAPLPIGDPSAGLKNSKRPSTVDEKTFARRLARLRALDAEFAARVGRGDRKVKAYGEAYEEAIRLMRSRDLEAFDLSKEPKALREAYGEDRFGQGVLLARRLVEHGVRYVEVTSGGWDTHNQNFDAMNTRVPPLDRTLAALLADLDSRGLLETTLVVLTTEFGRTPKIVTERSGRNHYPKAFSAMLAGGGIRGGMKYGKTCPEGREVIENKMLVPDFNATIAYALGLPHDHIVYSPSRRPFQVAHKGQPVTELFA